MKRTILFFIVTLALAFGLVTLVALEGHEVVVLRTFDSDGRARETRTWIADYQGAAYIEAANPQREFFRDIQQNPNVELVRHGTTTKYRAFIVPQELGHNLIRSLLHERYGWADAWIGVIADTSNSAAIRLAPAPTT